MPPRGDISIDRAKEALLEPAHWSRIQATKLSQLSLSLRYQIGHRVDMAFGVSGITATKCTHVLKKILICISFQDPQYTPQRGSDTSNVTMSICTEHFREYSRKYYSNLWLRWTKNVIIVWFRILRCFFGVVADCRSQTRSGRRNLTPMQSGRKERPPSRL